MRVNPLPDQDHVSRYCPPKTTINGQPTRTSFLYEPTPGDPSHSWVYGYGFEDDLVVDLIAEFVLRTYPAGKPWLL